MADNTVDMFSYLTDSLLFIIVSFLPFKEAARTCILSKRWRFIWRATKNIELEESYFVKQGEESNQNKQVQRKVFIDFAQHWIDTYTEPTANKFLLTFSNPKDHLLQIQNFIQFAVERKVKVLDLDFSNQNGERLDNDATSFELPSFVYGHENIESLKLFSCNISVSQFNNFLALKNLCLGWIKLTTFSFEVLLSNCQSLESLILRKCWGLQYLEISGPSLRTLVVDKCLNLENGFRIDAEKLQFFTYSGPLIFFQIEYLNSMVEAVLDFGLEFEFSQSGDILYNLLIELWCVRVLSVCSYMLQVIPTAEEPVSLKPPLAVQHLILKTALDVKEYYGISFFLNSCPQLEILSIDLGPARIFDEHGPWKLEEHHFLHTYPYVIIYACLKKSLREVNVEGFRGGINELTVLQYLINYGMVLEKMMIRISKEKGPDGADVGLVYRQKAMMLLSFKKASPHLRIFIC